MSKDKRLGRGLGALLEKVADLAEKGEVEKPEHLSVVVPCDSDVEGKGAEPELGTPKPIPVELIDANPWQPRMDFAQEELAELAESLKQHGLIQPVIVRSKGDRYELVAGERRLRAAKLAGWGEVPACLLDVDEREMAELALTENMQRKDLNAIEKATAFKNYIACYGGTHEELGERIGLSRAAVTNLLRLLDLPTEIQDLVQKELLSSGHARALLPLPQDWQYEIANRIIKENWTVRQTEAWVGKFLQGDADPQVPVGGKGARPQRSEQLRDLEQQLSRVLGTKVQVKADAKNNKGKLIIPFNSNDEFTRVYKLILANLR
ncbi:MAG: ParB/RepB/Spo0J family partition protein [Planctomycetia bacterium]|nr:ParB/RepB/Spo0J family partition protein [Planctomycetia bacterium]